MSLPPQLALMLGDVAGNVAACAEMAPGVPWSNAILDEMVEDLGYFQKNYPTPDGSTHVTVSIVSSQMRLKGETRSEYEVSVCARKAPDIEEAQAPRAHGLGTSRFPRTREGLREALEFGRAKVNRWMRTGFCKPCADATPPRKRQKLQHASECADCLAGRVMG